MDGYNHSVSFVFSLFSCPFVWNCFVSDGAPVDLDALVCVWCWREVMCWPHRCCLAVRGTSATCDRCV